MVIKLNEASFYDTIKNNVGKVSQARKDAKKARNNPLKNLTDAEEDDIKLSPTAYEIYKEFKKAKSDYDVQVDHDAGKLQATFDARKVPTSLVDDFKAQGKYDKYVTTYDPQTKEVTMLFDIEADPATESVMVPTPTPYKYKPAKAPKNHDDLLDESLEEDLTMTPVEPFQIDGSDDLGLRTEINGRSYDFIMKDDSPFSAEQMFHKINKMMQFSKGKALAFLKKHAVGTRTTSPLHESGNPFKSSFICQGCGKPLDQCTCEIDLSEIEDEDENTQEEGLELITEDDDSSVDVLSLVDELNSLPVRAGDSKTSYEDVKEYEAVLNKIPEGTRLTLETVAGTDVFEKLVNNKYGEWSMSISPHNEPHDRSAFDVARWLAARGNLARGDIEVSKMNKESLSSSSATQSSNIGSHKRSSIDLIPMGQSEEEDD